MKFLDFQDFVKNVTIPRKKAILFHIFLSIGELALEAQNFSKQRSVIFPFSTNVIDG